MERLAELISKLKEQFEHKADPAQLLVITQMIEEQLTRSLANSGKSMSTSKVAVVMPSPRVNQYALIEQEEEAVTVSPAKPAKAPVAESYSSSPREDKEPVKEPARNENFDESHKKFIPAEHKMPESVYAEHIEEQVESIDPIPPMQPASHWSYDPMKDIPTLASQKTFKELNEVIGVKDSSLNDRLKAEVMEIGHRLTDSPIRDLKRAIGVNDRFVFINELFRGDEVMYERSIKTINGFRIFAEAEYWIERELKVKLGWEEDKPITRQFIQLVKRRFS